MKKYYVIAGVLSKDYWNLGIEGTTLNGAKRSISWQDVGGNNPNDYLIAERVGATTFKCINTGNVIETRNGVYTKEAWERFKNEYAPYS